MGAFLSLINPIAKIIDKVIPDRAAAASAKDSLLSAEVQGEFTAALAQVETNKAEAASNNVFVAGWRPFIGWVCGSAFAYSFVLQPMIVAVCTLMGVSFDSSKLPVLNISQMMPVLLGMLGLGAMRSFDKSQGTGNGH